MNPHKLKPFQAETVTKALAFLSRPPHAVYLGHDQGLGKSVCALETIKQHMSQASLIATPVPILIIAPAVMLYTWQNEIKRHFQDYAEVIILDKGLHFKKPGAFNFNLNGASSGAPYLFYVTSYALAAANMERVPKQKGKNFRYLILDEAIALKNPQTLRTRAICSSLWPSVDYKIALCGTPFTQSVMDTYPVFSRMAPPGSGFPNFFAMAERYSHKDESIYGTRYHGIKNAKEFRSLIDKLFFIRKTKAQVAPELPEKIWTKITLPPHYQVILTPDQQAAQNEYLKKLKVLFASSSSSNTFQHIPVPPVSVANLRHQQGLKKVEAVVDFAKELLDNSIPIVIFAVHRLVISELSRHLFKYAPKVITGETSAKDRERAVSEFQAGKTNLFLANLVAGGVGITLTRAQAIILAELSYSATDIAQAVDRVHRIGRDKSAGPIDIYYFSVDGSVDEDVETIVIEKARAFNQVFE